MGYTLFTLVCVLLGNGIDFITTRIALRLGAYEQNPLVRRSILLVKCSGTLIQLAALLAVNNPVQQALVAGGILIFYSGVGAWNVQQIRTLQRRKT
jgi:hypothetical protein